MRTLAAIKKSTFLTLHNLIGRELHPNLLAWYAARGHSAEYARSNEDRWARTRARSIYALDEAKISVIHPCSNGTAC